MIEDHTICKQTKQNIEAKDINKNISKLIFNGSQINKANEMI